MRFACIILALACYLTPVSAQEKTDGPTDEKARKTYEKALKSLHERNKESALDASESRQAGWWALPLTAKSKMIKYGVEPLGEW